MQDNGHFCHITKHGAASNSSVFCFFLMHIYKNKLSLKLLPHPHSTCDCEPFLSKWINCVVVLRLVHLKRTKNDFFRQIRICFFGSHQSPTAQSHLLKTNRTFRSNKVRLKRTKQGWCACILKHSNAWPTGLVPVWK